MNDIASAPGSPHVVLIEEIPLFSPRLIELDIAKINRWVARGCPLWEWDYIRGHMRYVLTYILTYYALTPYQRVLFGLLILESDSIRANFNPFFMQYAWMESQPIGEESSSPVFYINGDCGERVIMRASVRSLPS